MCIFVILCVEKTLFYMREYSDAIKLPKSFRAVGFMYKIYKKGALDSQPQVIKFTSGLLPWSVVLWLLPALKLVAMI